MEYVVLLRGINVGGTSKVPMADLRRLLSASFGDVRTYIASGNVLVTSDSTADLVSDRVTELVRTNFDVTRLVTALALSADDYRQVIADAPRGFGSEPDEYRYDVAFYVGARREEIAPHVPVNPDVDTVTLGERAFYHRRVTALAGKSRMSRIASTPIYANLTVRNWRTATALADLLGR